MKNIADETHKEFEKLIHPLFCALAKKKGKSARALAMLCYQGYASTNFDNQEFENNHEAMCPHEALICKTIADLILWTNEEKPLTTEQIREFYGKR